MRLLTLFLVCAAAWGQFVADATNTYGNMPGVIFSTPSHNSTDTRFARLITVQKSGTIVKAGFSYAFAPVQNLDIRLETTTGSPLVPSGSLYGGSTAVTVASAGAVWHVGTFGTPATCTAGDVIAVVVQWTSTAGATSIITDSGTQGTFSSGAKYTSSAWAKITSAPILYLEYGDGTVHAGFASSISSVGGGSTSLNSGTTPDEVGNKWTFPVPTRISGAIVRSPSVSIGGSTSVLVTVGSTETTCASIGGADYTTGSFSVACASPIVVPANTPVYISIRATTSTNSFRDYKSKAYSAAHRAVGWPNTIYVQRTDAGAWTEDTTAISMAVMPLTDGYFLGSGGFQVSQ